MDDFDYSQPHKIVNGEPLLLTSEEIAEQKLREEAWLSGEAERANEEVLTQIRDLEIANVMPRAIRDIILKDVTNPAYAKVKSLDDQIAALRAQLTKE